MDDFNANDPVLMKMMQDALMAGLNNKMTSPTTNAQENYVAEEEEYEDEEEANEDYEEDEEEADEEEADWRDSEEVPESDDYDDEEDEDDWGESDEEDAEDSDWGTSDEEVPESDTYEEDEEDDYYAEDESTDDDDWEDFGSSNDEASSSNITKEVLNQGTPVSHIDLFDTNDSEDTTSNSEVQASIPSSPVESQLEAKNPKIDALEQQRIDLLVRQNELLASQIAALQGEIQSLKAFNNTSEQQEINNHARASVFDTPQPFESVISEPCTAEFMGTPFRYQRYEEEIKFDKRFEMGLSDEDTAKNYIDFVNKVTSDIEAKFGGFERIHSLAIVSNLIIINNVSYEPYLPDYYQEMLPFDLRNQLADGQFAWLFNFFNLKKMKMLANLKFDSVDFVYAKVRKDLGVVYNFEPSYFFKLCKKLQNLQIGEYVITSASIHSADGAFHKSSRSEEIYNRCLDLGMGATKKSWDSIKNVFNDTDRSGLSKAWGITWRGTGLAVASAGTLGVKAGGLVTKLGKGVANFTSIVKNNLK